MTVTGAHAHLRALVIATLTSLSGRFHARSGRAPRGESGVSSLHRRPCASLGMQCTCGGPAADADTVALACGLPAARLHGPASQHMIPSIQIPANQSLRCSCVRLAQCTA